MVRQQGVVRPSCSTTRLQLEQYSLTWGEHQPLRDDQGFGGSLIYYLLFNLYLSRLVFLAVGHEHVVLVEGLVTDPAGQMVGSPAGLNIDEHDESTVQYNMFVLHTLTTHPTAAPSFRQ